jgi:hypothetical protein
MLYGIWTLVAMLLSSAAIINSNAIEIAFAQTFSSANNTFDLTIDNQKYPLKYNITGGEVTSITADPAQATFLINVASREDGTLTIELPRNVIDSKAQGNTDEDYAVFVDDQSKSFEEITNNNEVRTIEIGFDNGAEKIEIAGTQITGKGATAAAATEGSNATTTTTEAPITINKNNATGTAATEGSNATGAKTKTANNTFDLTIDNQKYPLKYNITGGEVTSITADPAQATFLINVASREDGTLTIELPRNVIDSKAQGNTDEDYAVFVDDQSKSFEEITNNNEVRTIEIGFDNGAEKIEIAGTNIIPEFGPIATIILGIAMIIFIIATTRYNKFSFHLKH